VTQILIAAATNAISITKPPRLATLSAVESMPVVVRW
jgi:hypothetical protein